MWHSWRKNIKKKQKLQCSIGKTSNDFVRGSVDGKCYARDKINCSEIGIQS